MEQQTVQQLLTTFKANEIAGEELIQRLWSNYGQILRVHLQGGTVPSVIVKNILNAPSGNHPRGWNTNTSHNRKVNSYNVEAHWYQHWAKRCGDLCRVAACYSVSTTNKGKVIILEDLDQAGFTVRKSHLDVAGAKLCLRWLANFHAVFMNETPSGLWQTGTYWHLATRPDELEAMKDSPLKQAAKKIDEQLNNCQYQTIVHGDAKIANFCFDSEGKNVAAVDFQYVGGGCGMKDVVYFLGSCLTEKECELYEQEMLDHYFTHLQTALSKTDKNYDFKALRKEWEDKYAIAWADFMRFLLGWSPSHQKINQYSKKQIERALKQSN